MSKILGLLCAVLVTMLVIAVPAFAYDPLGGPCTVNTTTGDGSGSAICQDRGSGSSNPLTGQNGLLIGIANVIALSTGIIAVIIIIVSGFRYITAGGEAAKAKSARDSIIAALVGLVIIALAGTLINFVISRI